MTRNNWWQFNKVMYSRDTLYLVKIYHISESWTWSTVPELVNSWTVVVYPDRRLGVDW